MDQEKYIDIVNAIDGIQDIMLVNKKMIGDDIVSDFDEFILQQNKYLGIAVDVMLEKIDDLSYTE